jgi:ADP-heptose:LPS heptosyltransferase
VSDLVAAFQIGSMGDSIVSIPTLLSLKELLPGCSEYLLISQFDSALKVTPGGVFKMAWPPARELQYASSNLRLQQLFTVPALLAKLRYYKPRYCLNLLPADRTPEQVRRDKAFFKLGGIKEFLGFDAPAVSQTEPLSSSTFVEGTEAYLRFQRIWGESTPERFKRYTHVPIMQPDSEATQRVNQWLSENRKHPQKRLIAISPYSNYPSRNIPDVTISELVETLSAQADAEIVIVGGGKDFERAAAFGRALNACGKLSIPESGALLQSCSLAICTESGPMHLASAIGVPLLAMFSRINPQLARWLPFGQRSTILYREVACAGCYSPHCKVPGHPCMELISAAQLLYSARNLLQGLPVLESRLNGTKVLTW